MQFLVKALGVLNTGRAVRVSLSGSEANVMLLDDVNLSSYRAGRQYRYYGGHTKTSPVLLKVPHTGSWNVVVDLGGYGGSIGASVQVI